MNLGFYVAFFRRSAPPRSGGGMTSWFVRGRVETSSMAKKATPSAKKKAAKTSRSAKKKDAKASTRKKAAKKPKKPQKKAAAKKEAPAKKKTKKPAAPSTRKKAAAKGADAKEPAAKAGARKSKRAATGRKADKRNKKRGRKRSGGAPRVNVILPPPRKDLPAVGVLPRAADLVEEEREAVRKKASRLSSKIKSQIEQIRQMLIDRRRELMEGINRGYREARQRDVDHVGDEADMAMEAADSDLNLRLAEKESLEITQIEDALHKIDEGTYGLCERCSRPILFRRLEALPFATMCVDCKRLEEMEKTDDDDDDEWEGASGE